MNILHSMPCYDNDYAITSQEDHPNLSLSKHQRAPFSKDFGIRRWRTNWTTSCHPTQLEVSLWWLRGRTMSMPSTRPLANMPVSTLAPSSRSARNSTSKTLCLALPSTALFWICSTITSWDSEKMDCFTKSRRNILATRMHNVIGQRRQGDIATQIPLHHMSGSDAVLLVPRLGMETLMGLFGAFLMGVALSLVLVIFEKVMSKIGFRVSSSSGYPSPDTDMRLTSKNRAEAWIRIKYLVGTSSLPPSEKDELLTLYDHN